MPLYEFECEACKSRFERIQKFADANPEVCPTCGKGPVHRLMSSPAIQFKGSGFYITDYAKKSGSEGGGSKGKSESKSEGGSDSKSDGKTESTSESTSKDSSTKSDSSPAPASTATAPAAKKD